MEERLTETAIPGTDCPDGAETAVERDDAETRGSSMSDMPANAADEVTTEVTIEVTDEEDGGASPLASRAVAAAEPPPDRAEHGRRAPEAPLPELPEEPDARELALAQREQAVMQRELRLQALDALQERGLPVELLPTLPVESISGMRAALDGLDAAFRAAVESSVRTRLASPAPTLGQSAAASREAALREAMGLQP